MQWLLGLFFIAHGLIHGSYLTKTIDDPNYPFDFSKGWLYHLMGSGAAVPIGMTLSVITLCAFCVAGLGVFGTPGLAAIIRPTVAIGSLSSLLLLVLFWHKWLILGIVINLVLLYGAFMLKWSFR